MRLEKSFGTWAREFRPIYGPDEAGLGRFVDWRKGEFVGRDGRGGRARGGRRAAAAGHASRSRRPMPTRSATSRSGTTARSWAGSRRAATATASASRWRSGYVPKELAQADEGFEIEIMGERRPARRLDGAAFDPEGSAHAGVTE